jgi:nucleotide-binding universal stress UspA family protein
LTAPERLILPLDGSRASDQAVPLARLLALRMKAPVTVLHVFDSVKALTRAAEAQPEWDPNAQPRATVRAPASIRDSVAELSAADIDVTVIGRHGDVAAQVCAEASSATPGWILMASLGATGIRRLLLGSNAVQTVRGSSTPVIIVPARYGVAANFEDDLARVALFLDGSWVSERAIPAACTLAQALDAQLDVVRVAETYQDDVNEEDLLTERDPGAGALESTVTAYVETISQRCAAAGLRTRALSLSGTPARQIARYVAEAKPDVVVLGTVRRSGIERWTYGNFAEQLVGALPAPTMLVPVDPDEAPPKLVL